MKYRVWVFSSFMRRFVALDEFENQIAAEAFRFQWQMKQRCTAIERIDPEPPTPIRQEYTIRPFVVHRLAEAVSQ